MVLAFAVISLDGDGTAALQPPTLKSHGCMKAQREFELKDGLEGAAASGGWRSQSLTSNSLCAAVCHAV
jgi:hypothetical protein